MDLTNPASSVVPALRARILVLLARSDAGLTGRRVAALAEGSVAGVAKVLESLVGAGLVHRIDAGSASLYTLNRDHVGAPAVELLATMRAELINRIRRDISQWSCLPVGAVLFGSAARGDGADDSDIDVLLVRPASIDDDDAAWADQVSRLGSAVLAWSGNTLNVVEYSPDEVASDAPGRRAVLSRIDTDGVLLHGTELRILRRRTRAVGR